MQTVTQGIGSLFEMVEKRPAYMTPPSRTPAEIPENYTGLQIYILFTGD